MTPARRTTCLWCPNKLTHDQQVRRRVYCSRTCAKTHFHAENPTKAREAGLRAAAATRPQYVARLKQTLAGCRTLGEAYRLGYNNGYKVGATRRRRAAKVARLIRERFGKR